MNAAVALALPPAPLLPAEPARAAVTHPAGPPVVLALCGADLPTPTLHRAVALARLQGVMLHVVRVLPEVSWVQPLFPQDGVASSVSAMFQEMAIVRTTGAWLAVHLPDDTPHELAVCTGGFVPTVSAYAREHSAGLIVVAPMEGMGALIASLAVDANVPVLVGREATTTETIVAATDLESAGTPVLWDAALLARRLDAPLVAVHNHVPYRVMVGPDLSPWVTVLPSREALKARSRIHDAVSHLPVAAEPVLRQDTDPVGAILREARAVDADVIAVGVRPRSLLEEVGTTSVTAGILDAAHRSVLVVPVQDGPSVHA